MRQFLTDLRVVVLFALAGIIALLVPDIPWQVEWVLGLPLLLFLPGYALVAALFIERPAGPADGHRSPGWPARFGLSMVGSLIIVAVIGVLLASEGPGTFTLTPTILSIGGVTLLGVLVAAVRRTSLPLDRRADALATLSSDGTSDTLGTNGLQSLALVLALVVLASALVFAGTAPPTDPHSEVYLSGGESVDVTAENATLVADSANSIAITLENHEGELTDYQVVTRVQRVGANGTVQAEERLDDFQVALAANETRVIDRTLTPTLTGERLRLQVLVYKGGVDGAIGPGNADLSLRLWVTITDGGVA